jgi:hypothetical protein
LAQPLQINDLDLSSSKAHQALLLQSARRRIYACSLDAQHRGEIGLCETKRGAVGAAVKPYQPLGQSIRH